MRVDCLSMVAICGIVLLYARRMERLSEFGGEHENLEEEGGNE